MIPPLLSGIRILDLADEKASYCCKLLADMGAQVIKIEKPGGDASRKIGPCPKLASGQSASLSFLFNNANKMGITLDIGQPRGRDLFLQLAQQSHAVVESYPVGVLDQIGLSYQALSERNRKLILVSVTGFGQTGPASRHPSCDLVAAATGGQMSVTGDPSAPPLRHPADQSYLAGSLFAALGIVLALRKVRLTGNGDHIDISLQESVAATLEHVMVRYFTDQVIPQRQGSLHWNHFTHILPCRDGWIQLTLLEQWDTLVAWLDSEGMAADLTQPQWKQPQYRQAHADHIIAVIANWTQTHTENELFETAQLMQLPWAPVADPKKVPSSPQLEARRFFRTPDGPLTGIPLKYPGLPFRCTPPMATPLQAAPGVGQHNAEIYGKGLGLSDRMIKDLTARGVL